MADPTTYTKYLIGVKASGTPKIGTKCKITNLLGRGTITEEFRTGNECVLNPATSKLNWVIGDKLMVEISGVLVGSREITLVKGGLQITVTTSTEDSIAVDL